VAPISSRPKRHRLTAGSSPFPTFEHAAGTARWSLRTSPSPHPPRRELAPLPPVLPPLLSSAFSLPDCSGCGGAAGAGRGGCGRGGRVRGSGVVRLIP
jgi:hypothetical protein